MAGKDWGIIAPLYSSKSEKDANAYDEMLKKKPQKSPGPGAYNVSRIKDCRGGYSFGIRPFERRTSSVGCTGIDITGNYQYNKWNKSPAYSFRSESYSFRNNNPGPCYQPYPDFGTKSDPFKTSAARVFFTGRRDTGYLNPMKVQKDDESNDS